MALTNHNEIEQVKTARDIHTGMVCIAAAVAIAGVIFVLQGHKPTAGPGRLRSHTPVELITLKKASSDRPEFAVAIPTDLRHDPAVVNQGSGLAGLWRHLDDVMEASDRASEFALEDTGRDAGSQGHVVDEMGIPRELRWIIELDGSSIDRYAEQIDYFQIELGALGRDSVLTYLSDVTGAGRLRRRTSGKGEGRLYFAWDGPDRRESDIELFRRFGIWVGDGLMLHFYEREVEQVLLHLERDFADRHPSEIRRTHFSVRENEQDYEFFVTKQTYLNRRPTQVERSGRNALSLSGRL